MRLPIRHVAGNVIWTVHGTCWGIWKVEGSGSAHASLTAKKRRLATIEALVKAVPGEAMLLSLCPQIDPATVVKRMTCGVDLEHPGSERYVELSLRVLDQLEGLELTGRTDWLAIPLSTGRRLDAVRSAVSAARADLTLALGLLPAPIPASEEVARLEEATRLRAKWPMGLRLRPAREAEILWIYGHAARRGVLEPLLPDPRAAREVLGRGRNVAALGEVILAEGALADADEGGAPSGVRGSARRQEAPTRFSRRWLKVSTQWGDSYQALLGLSEMPRAFAWPGAELLASLDEHAFPVDWVVRLTTTAGRVAEAKSRRAARELASQPEEYGADPAGVPDSLEQDSEDLREYRTRLTANSTEVEVCVMAAMCVWGATPDEAVARADQLAQNYSGSDYALTRTLGEQEALWYGMLPGARTPSVLLSYRQHTLARDFAMTGPYSTSALGDESGPLFGLQLCGGGLRPVHVDFAAAPRKQKASAAAAFLGELGSGKSTAMKSATYLTLASGHLLGRPGSRSRAVIVDRTPQQEWVRFAHACPGTQQVITVGTAAKVSLDPLRVFHADPKQAARFTESFLTLLLGVAPMSEEGIALSEAIAAVLARPGASMNALHDELDARGRVDATCGLLARKLASHRAKDLAKTLFDPALPILDMASADVIVFSVANLELPTKEELTGARWDRLEYEKVFGRAVLYLVGAISRQIAFNPQRAANPHLPPEFTLAVWDECWWLTSSPEGLKLLLELLRDGRKHDAGVLVGSHDGEDIGPSDTEMGQVVRGLIKRWFLFRQTDAELARRGLAVMGLPASEELLTTVQTELSPVSEDPEEQKLRAGQCLHRDLYGRTGGMQVIIPPDEKVAAAIHSDPVPAS
ncbi:ATP-binding protein [Streptantibioticus ferralitis]|uniref:ATP-binding protein n=1 Tax=Streptantibioticus ferralitis TaxID=236510 RepID=A0ABT5Z764_9ACTN|nr:ATP-binding protein [Streptantibioticus ferralitis]MDF2259676.1 ATP-binding protein [Streptantibioticus ferralitis]